MLYLIVLFLCRMVLDARPEEENGNNKGTRKEAEPEYDDGFQCYTWENERSISVNNRTCAEGIDRVRLYPEYQSVV